MANRFLNNIKINDSYTLPPADGTADQVITTDGSGNLSFTDIIAGEADKALSLTLRVKNTESVALTKGQVVCAAPTATPPSGNVIEVKLADNNGTDSMPAIGILNEGLDAAGGANDEGEAIMFGRISGINTSAFSVGDEVFVSDTAGGLTTTKPTGVKYIQKVGVVMRDDASNGTIEVFGAGRTNDVPTPLYVDHLNQRIGIGEENPSSQLHINSDVGSPRLTLSYAPSSGYGGGGDIRIEGGSNDYVFGGIEWYNGGLRDGRLYYAAASREMSFRANERGVSGNGYFRFYNGATEIAEINSAGVYGNVFYDQGNTAYYLNPASTSVLDELNVRREQRWFRDSSNNAHQRVDGRLDGADQARLHWYGKDDSNNTRNFKHAWFDGSDYIDVTASSGGTISFTGTASSMYIGTDRVFDDGYHPYADTWSNARTLTLTGDVSGSVSWDGSANASLSVTVNNDSHTHDGRYYTETESDSRFINVTGDTMTGALTASGGINGLTLANGISGSNFNITGVNQLSINDPGEGILFGGGSNNVTLYAIDDSTDNKMNFSGASELQVNGSKVFHDGYHPNADTWTTGRTITIGDTGKSVNGSANVSWSLSEIGAAASSHEHTWAEINGATSNSINGWGGLRHTTNSGYIDFGPANTSYAHIYTDRPNFYLNKSLTVSGSSIINSGDIRSNIFYDLNNTAYYGDFAGNSRYNTAQGNYLGLGTSANTSGGYRLNMGGSIDMNSNSVDYVSQLHFNDNVRFYDDGNDSYLNFKYGDATTGGIKFVNGGGSVKGYVFADDSGFGLLDNDGAWALRTRTGQDPLELRCDNNIEFSVFNSYTLSHGSSRAPIFYDSNNTGYFFNGDAAKDGVDLTSSGNHAVHVLGTISGGHRKHNNLETPEMEWSVGGGTDLNWKKLCDIVINDANYSGWGAEIEITDFSGNFGNATYGGGELFKGALSIYHWGGTGDTTETAYANIPYEMAGHVRWYKINESGQNRYQLQVKSPANYRQLYVKIKPGIANQVDHILSYANDTNGTTSGGTAYASIQNSNFNHEFAGGIWTNDSRTIGWKNAYGNPHFSSYYGTITTNATLYVGGTTSTTTNLYSGYSRASVFYDRNNSAYYMDGNSTGDSIRVAGDVVAYYSSDKRYKDNIKPIDNALDKVKAINGVTFNWNEKSHKETGKKDVGVIAQEVEEVLPEIVQTRDNGYKAVDYQKLTAVLIESVKELTAKVEALEAKQCNCK